MLLYIEEQKCYLQWELNLGILVIRSDGYLTNLTWQMLIEAYYFWWCTNWFLDLDEEVWNQ